MTNVQYSFVSSEKGNLTFRSTVNSFGLDHVTDKDISSFYASFSSYSYIDTGLLPVDGSGLLAYRSAGNHSQIVYQHKPGLYYINWGEYEGDHNATKYYVAQPYRIVIADLLDGNLLGARTFYSPVPITHSEDILYHVNLPNINCKGYRGNAVGWICLYHNHDISSYPFSEKLAHILERCSGVEAYNDQNMSETDGPRFYSYADKPQILWDPVSWEAHSSEHGYEWTLDPDLWIPVLVYDKDNQDKHYDGGKNLTISDAILGNYQAYYTDPLIPKHINKISREDYSLESSLVFDWFKQAYNSSHTSLPTINTISQSQEIKHSQNLIQQPSLQNDDPEPTWTCEDCSESYYDFDDCNETHTSAFICNGCFESYIYCKNTKTYHHPDDGEVLYLNLSNLFIYLPQAEDSKTYKYCNSCDTGVWHEDSVNWSNFNILSPTESSDLSGCTLCCSIKQESELPF